MLFQKYQEARARFLCQEETFANLPGVLWNIFSQISSIWNAISRPDKTHADRSDVFWNIFSEISRSPKRILYLRKTYTNVSPMFREIFLQRHEQAHIWFRVLIRHLLICPVFWEIFSHKYQASSTWLFRQGETLSNLSRVLRNVISEISRSPRVIIAPGRNIRKSAWTCP